MITVKTSKDIRETVEIMGRKVRPGTEILEAGQHVEAELDEMTICRGCFQPDPRKRCRGMVLPLSNCIQKYQT